MLMMMMMMMLTLTLTPYSMSRIIARRRHTGTPDIRYLAASAQGSVCAKTVGNTSWMRA
jgi:hypothetical protein